MSLMSFYDDEVTAQQASRLNWSPLSLALLSEGLNDSTSPPIVRFESLVFGGKCQRIDHNEKKLLSYPQ